MSSTDLNPGMFATTGAEGVAPVVTTLQKVWKRLQKVHPTLPDATIVIKRDSRAWGHTTTVKVWGSQATKGRGKAKTVSLANERYEVMVSGENLSRGAEAVLGTLLHEAAHALNLAAEVRDVDSNGRHNKKFKATAETGQDPDRRSCQESRTGGLQVRTDRLGMEAEHQGVRSGARHRDHVQRL